MKLFRITATDEVAGERRGAGGRRLTVLYVPQGARLAVKINDGQDFIPVLPGFSFTPPGGIEKLFYQVTTAAPTAGAEALLVVDNGVSDLDSSAYSLAVLGTGGSDVETETGTENIAAAATATLLDTSRPAKIEALELTTSVETMRFTVSRNRSAGGSAQLARLITAAGGAGTAYVSPALVRSEGSAVWQLVTDAAGTYRLTLRPELAGLAAPFGLTVTAENVDLGAQNAAIFVSMASQGLTL